MSNHARIRRLERLQRLLEEIEFGNAMERYVRLKGRQALTWADVLMVVKVLGYRKVVAEAREPRPHSE